MYITVKTKLTIACMFAIVWLSASIYLGLPWLNQLSVSLGWAPAFLIVTGIALIPGLGNAFLLCSIFFDRRPDFGPLKEYPPLTILIAAYNEEDCIAETIESIFAVKYPSNLHIIVSDDGSTDRTSEIVHEAIEKYKLLKPFKITHVLMPENQGKANALNNVLELVETDYCITIDADTYLFKDALQNLVSNIMNGPENTAAVAGAVLVRNSRVNWLTKIQEWDYFHGIAVVKRIQSLYQGTLVAQGAFSIYLTTALFEIGGWDDTVGEDIVLTWALRDEGYRISYDERAICFTNVPDNYKQFFSQRKRWARGLIEAFKKYPSSITTMSMTTPFIWLNMLFPFMDFVFATAFIPGLIAAIVFQNYTIVGLMTVILLPMALLMNFLIYYKHTKTFRQADLKVRQNKLGFILYVLFYQLIMVPASLAGYLAELFNLKKSWGTK